MERLIYSPNAYTNKCVHFEQYNHHCPDIFVHIGMNAKQCIHLRVPLRFNSFPKDEKSKVSIT